VQAADHGRKERCNLNNRAFQVRQAAPPDARRRQPRGRQGGPCVETQAPLADGQGGAIEDERASLAAEVREDGGYHIHRDSLSAC
jgi:hypothetical protein